jgi:uncharacterized cupin superfamily protein
VLPGEVVDYPDSGNRMLSVGGLPTGDGDGVSQSGATRRERVILRGGVEVSYWDGEPEALVPCPEKQPDLEAAARSPADAPETGTPGLEARDRRIVNVGDVPWEPFGVGPFGGERRRLAGRVGARLLGYAVCRLARGARAWAFHFHHVNEEFFYVRSGRGELRTRDGVRALRPGDAFACPPGPAGAHQLRHAGAAPLEYFALSTMEPFEVTEYPDSRKVYVMVGSAPGGRPEEREVDALFRVADSVEYVDGEA